MENKQLTKIESNNRLTQLQNISDSITVRNLAANNFKAIIQSVGNSVKDILDRPAIVMVKKLIDPVKLQVFLANELNKLANSVNIDDRLNLQPQQIPMISEQLIVMYPVESLEDFVLCFRRGSLGFYGSIYRIDAAVIQDWMSKYLDEKYSLIEKGYQDKAKDEKQEPSIIDYEEFKNRSAEFVNPPKQTNQKENDYQKWRLEYLESRKKQHDNNTETQTPPSE